MFNNNKDKIECLESKLKRLQEKLEDLELVECEACKTKQHKFEARTVESVSINKEPMYTGLYGVPHESKRINISTKYYCPKCKPSYDREVFDSSYSTMEYFVNEKEVDEKGKPIK